MGKGKRYFTFDGQFEERVLGTFRIIRGFAYLRDLAEISVPFEMETTGNAAEVKGQQRKLDLEHAERIKRYLESGQQRFLPEVILSIRVDLDEERSKTQKAIGVRSKTSEDGITISRRWRSENIHVHRVKIERKKLENIRDKKLIRRVDGNHRLALAERLKEDPSVPTKYLAPFCLVLLNASGGAADDYSESLIFHTINSTALPLESEHALKLILGQHADYDMTPENEFAFSPDLHFTRLLRDGLLKLPEPVQTRLGNRPLTSLRCAVCGLLDIDPTVAKDLPTLKKYSKALLAVLNDVVTRLEPSQPSLCKSEFFIELAARVWKATSDEADHTLRVNETVSYLGQLATWLGKDGFVELKEGCSLCKQLLDIFGTVRKRIPKRIFLARWYPIAKDGDALRYANLRLKQINQTLTELKSEGVELKLEDMGTKEGGTFPIHDKMYEAIESSEIILVDLTGIRPNVCIEAGYALSHHVKNRLLFIFQKIKDDDEVPFDLKTYTYLPFTDCAEIPQTIKPHIKAILRSAESGC
jgi:hypothetical protein